MLSIEKELAHIAIFDYFVSTISNTSDLLIYKQTYKFIYLGKIYCQRNNIYIYNVNKNCFDKSSVLPASHLGTDSTTSYSTGTLAPYQCQCSWKAEEDGHVLGALNPAADPDEAPGSTFWSTQGMFTSSIS